MAPRNKDMNSNCKKTCVSLKEDNSDLDVNTFVPCILHKKHKVVKLVKSQLKKIHEEGLLDGQGFDMADVCQFGSKLNRASRAASEPESAMNRANQEIVERRENEHGCICLFFYLLAIIASLLVVTLLAVWISAGPLSNPMAYTPIPAGSFVRTDGLCSLEKKYLLRWGKPDYI